MASFKTNSLIPLKRKLVQAIACQLLKTLGALTYLDHFDEIAGGIIDIKTLVLGQPY